MGGGVATNSNPRRANSTKRNHLAAKVKARGEPCWICELPIDLSLKSPHPLSFNLDEIVPVSRWEEFGYASAEACALDPNNARLPTHRRCNQWRGNRLVSEVEAIKRGRVESRRPVTPSTEWL